MIVSAPQSKRTGLLVFLLLGGHIRSTDCNNYTGSKQLLIEFAWKVASGGALSQASERTLTNFPKFSNELYPKTLNTYREASYLLTRYLLTSYGPSGRPQSYAQIEYDPPWLSGASMCATAGGDHGILKDYPSAKEKGTSSEVVVELGSGMGTAGLAAAEALHRLQVALLSTTVGSTSGVVTHTNDPGDPTVLNEKFVERETRRPTSVVLTDLPDVCMLLRENVSMQLDDWKRAGMEGIAAVNEDNEYNERDLVQLRVRKLSWGNGGHIRNVSKELQGLRLGEEDINMTILCSDLVYFPHLLAPLLRTLIYLTSPSFLPNTSTEAKTILSYRIRSPTKEMPFWRAFGRWFSFQPVLERREDRVWRRLGWEESALSFVFVAHRRPETLTWHCPEEDDELLHGTGSDDTFEILLMLCTEVLDD